MSSPDQTAKGDEKPFAEELRQPAAEAQPAATPPPAPESPASAAETAPPPAVQPIVRRVAPGSAVPQAQLIHMQRMASDRAYAEDFLKNSIGEEVSFTVTFKCKDSLQSKLLFDALRTNNPGADPVLICGCAVETIYQGDVAGEYAILQKAIARAVKPYLPKS